MELRFFKNYLKSGVVTVHLLQGAGRRCTSGHDIHPATEGEFVEILDDRSVRPWGWSTNASGEVRVVDGRERIYRRWTCRICWWHYRDYVTLRLGKVGKLPIDKPHNN